MHRCSRLGLLSLEGNIIRADNTRPTYSPPYYYYSYYYSYSYSYYYYYYYYYYCYYYVNETL